MQQDPSTYFCCPITCDSFSDPVIAADGNTYERAAIQDWFNRCHDKSPMTNVAIDASVLIQNRNLKSLQDLFEKEVKPYYQDLEQNVKELKVKLAKKDEELASITNYLMKLVECFDIRNNKISNCPFCKVRNNSNLSRIIPDSSDSESDSI
jgi:hypothetical protein